MALPSEGEGVPGRGNGINKAQRPPGGYVLSVLGGGWGDTL